MDNEFNSVKKQLSADCRSAVLYFISLAKWLAVAALIGLCCGVVGTAFHVGVELVTEARAEHVWLLYALPVAGLGIVAFYKKTAVEGLGTNAILEAVSADRVLPIWLLPAIFLGTVLTHLCGGSSGREGAALQMGGDIGQHVGRLFRLDRLDRRVATLSGMAAFFSALFGTPLAATMFAIMVVSVGSFYHSAFVPCLVSALVAYQVSILLGVAPTRFAVTAPALDTLLLARVAVLAVLCALVSVVFCFVLHTAEHLYAHYLPNAYLRVAVGGAIVVALTLLCGTTDYNGAGMGVIVRAVEGGQASPVAFLLKMLFTALTLGAGFKGGEVVPSFFVGATFGCAVAPLLGIAPQFGAAVGLVAVFCGATNCPVASIFLAIELFGSEGLWYYAIACGISYMLSGYSGLYSSQLIRYSKLKARKIKAKTNGYHTGSADADREPDEQEKKEENELQHS